MNGTVNNKDRTMTRERLEEVRLALRGAGFSGSLIHSYMYTAQGGILPPKRLLVDDTSKLVFIPIESDPMVLHF